MRTEALIFDMDGTMVDSMPWHARSWVAFCAQHGLAVELPELLRRTTGRTGHECMLELFQRDLSRDESSQLIAHKEELYRELFAPAFAEVAGFRVFAAQARAAGLKLGIGTAGDRHNIAFTMGRLEITPALDAIVGGDEGLPGKPEPAIFLEAARRMRTDAGACIVFEDAPLGIEAARRAGMRAVAVCTSYTPQELAGPHVLLHMRDYNELMHNDFLETIHAAKP